MYDPYLVLSSSALALSPDVLERELDETVDATTSRSSDGGINSRMRSGACGTIRLDVLEGQQEEEEEERFGSSSGRGGELQEQWTLLLGRFYPVGVIAVSGGVGLGRGGDAEGERAARLACGRAQVKETAVFFSGRSGVWLYCSIVDTGYTMEKGSGGCF